MFSVKEVTRPGHSRSSLGSVPAGTTFLLQGNEIPHIRLASAYGRDRGGLVDVARLDNGLLYKMPESNPVYLIDIEGRVSFVGKE